MTLTEPRSGLRLGLSGNGLLLLLDKIIAHLLTPIIGGIPTAAVFGGVFWIGIRGAGTKRNDR